MVSARRSQLATALVAVLAIGFLAGGCGGSDDLMSRQDFVDNLNEQGGELLDENISSCMYDRLEDDPEARDAVENWEDGDDVPNELLDLAVDCLRDIS